MGADHGCETLPHVHLDVAVDQEVTPQPVLLRVGKPPVWTLMVLDLIGQQQDGGGYRLYDKRLGGADAAYVDGVAGEVPALAVSVVVVPDLPKVQVEHIPANPLVGLRDDRRRVAHERAPVEAVGGNPGTSVFGDRVGRQGVDIGPLDLSSRRDRPGRRVGAPATTLMVPFMNG